MVVVPLFALGLFRKIETLSNKSAMHWCSRTHGGGGPFPLGGGGGPLPFGGGGGGAWRSVEYSQLLHR